VHHRTEVRIPCWRTCTAVTPCVGTGTADTFSNSSFVGVVRSCVQASGRAEHPVLQELTRATEYIQHQGGSTLHMLHDMLFCMLLPWSLCLALPKGQHTSCAGRRGILICSCVRLCSSLCFERLVCAVPECVCQRLNATTCQNL
jgi:hypothetical protein